MVRRVLHGIRKLTGVRAWVSERDELRANGTMRPRQALLNDVPRSRETYPGAICRVVPRCASKKFRPPIGSTL
jgi:hypothetical protein